MEPRQRHWRNHLAAGDTAFVTTKCLDFTEVFSDPRMRDLMAASLLEDCRRAGGFLHAFVIMTHHVHFLASVPPPLTPQAFVCRVKTNSARRIGPLLDPVTQGFLDRQRGLNRHTLWARSFRALDVLSPEVFDQKVDYIHFNPVRKEMCALPEEYRWSSAWAYSHGFGLERGCLDCGRLVRHYAPDGLPPVSGGKR